jgi:hypothetical protein
VFSLKREEPVKSATRVTPAVALLALAIVLSAAEEKFGVKVYEGAKPDKETSEAVSQTMSVEAFCYRTTDSVDKVITFYKKEPGLEFLGGDKQNGMFKKGDVDVTIQNPWMNMKTGQLTKDTLISIVKH